MSRKSVRVQELVGRLSSYVRRYLRPGGRLAGESELAKRFSVGIWSLRKALTELGRLGLIVRTPRVGTFVAKWPGPVGRTLALVSGIPEATLAGWPFSAGFLAGLALECSRRQMRLRIVSPPPEHEPWQRLDCMNQLDLGSVDAVALFQQAGIERLPVVPTVPLVGVEFPVPGAGASLVSFDWQAGMRAILNRLVEVGHRRIGWIGETFIREHEDQRDPRYDLFLQAVGRLRLDLPLDWIVPLRGTRDDCDRIGRLVELPLANRPTAVLLRGLTWPPVAELVRRGVRIGPEMSVVSTDLASMWGGWYREVSEQAEANTAWARRVLGSLGPIDPVREVLERVDLAGVDRDVAELGRAVAAEVDRRWADPLSGGRQVLLPLRLREGASLMAPPQQ